MKSVKVFGGRNSSFTNCNFFSDDSSYSVSRCSNSSPLCGLSLSPSNDFSSNSIPVDTRSAVNLTPFVNNVVLTESSVRDEPK